MSIRGTQAASTDDYSCRAGEVLAQYRAVVLDSIENGDHIVKYPSAARDVAYGITQEAAAASGDRISVRRGGTSYVEVDEATTLGRVAMIADTVGRVEDTASNNWASGDGVVGSFDEAATASGDKVIVKLNLYEVVTA
jgi:hypothetical protein